MVLEIIFQESGNVGVLIGFLEDGNYIFYDIGICVFDDDQFFIKNLRYFILFMIKFFMGFVILIFVVDGRYGICFEIFVKDIFLEFEG